jgi:hypothetical protein
MLCLSTAGNRVALAMVKSALLRGVALWAPPLLAVAWLPAHADVYKCAGTDSTPIYQEMPCDKGKELRNFQTDPPEITVLPGTPTGSSPRPPAKQEKDAKNAAAAGKAKAAATATPRDDAQRKFAHAGMTEAEVRALLGPPDVTSGSGHTRRWQYMPSAGDPDTITALTMADGVVTMVERRIVRK